MSTEKKIIVLCPNCQQPVIWKAEQKFRPFCSDRCKLIDFGEWAAEEKKIAGDPIHPESNIDCTMLDHDDYLH